MSYILSQSQEYGSHKRQRTTEANDVYMGLNPRRYAPKIGVGKVKSIKGLAAKVRAIAKAMPNKEIKEFVVLKPDENVGQLNVNASGRLCRDMTPQPANGTTELTRIGGGIELINASCSIQFWGQTNTYTHDTKAKLEIWQVNGDAQTAADFASGVYSVLSNNSGLLDYTSTFQTEEGYQTRSFVKKLLYCKDYLIKSAPLSTVVPVLTHDFDLDLRGIIVNFVSTTTTVASGQIMMVIRCDSGNIGAVSTASYCPILTATSGLHCNIAMHYKYSDN